MIRLAAFALFCAALLVSSHPASADPIHPAPGFSALYQFQGGSDGAGPSGDLIFDGSGALYGTTMSGGSSGKGTVFKLTPPATQGGNWTKTTLYSFAGGSSDGASPTDRLIIDTAGALYGTTPQGGSANCSGGCGIAFKLTPPAIDGDPWTETVLYTFLGNPDAALPSGGLTYAAATPGAPYDGLSPLYGTAQQGGIHAASNGVGGAVFKLTPPANPGDPWTESLLYSFDPTNASPTHLQEDGYSPAGGVVFGPDGALYGTAALGGALYIPNVLCHCGTTFKLAPDGGGGWQKTTLYSFDGNASGKSDGAFPEAAVVFGSDGSYYGTTSEGGDYRCPQGCGTVFRLPAGAPPSDRIYAFRLDSPDGFVPRGRLYIDSAGALYGTASSVGAGLGGTIFKLIPPGENGTWPETILYSFADTGPNATGKPQAGMIADAWGALYGTSAGENTAGNFGAVWAFVQAPAVTGVSPNSGPSAGGTNVTITGSGFTGATGVTFGGTAATNVVVVNDITITATAPAHAGGAVDVAVTTFGGTATAAGAYTYFLASTTALGSSQNPSVYGQSVTFTATVTAGATGTVTFMDDVTTLGTGDLSGGVATFLTSSLAVGSHPITAVYGGDANFTGSTSPGVTQTVNLGATTTALGSSVNPSATGQSVTFTATVTATSPAAGTPTGTVTFKDGTDTLGTGGLSGGVATLATSSLAIGSHSITAVYGGDTGFAASTSSALTQTVNPTNSSLNTYVSALNGNDTGLCPITAPCVTLNYALNVTGVQGQVTVIGGGVFGPILLTKEVSIIGYDPVQPLQIAADSTAAVGCVATAPGSCGVNNGYGVEIAAGVSDTVKLTNVTVTAGTNGAGALKFTSGGAVQLSENVYRGNDTATGPIVALYPNNPGTTQAQVYFSNSDIGFNNSGATAGAVEVKPNGNTSLKLHFNHVEVHNASYGIRTDSSLLSGPSVSVTTAISESEFFSFGNAAVNAFSTAGTGTTNAAFDAVRILNATVAIKANGPQSVVVLTNSTLSGNGTGVQVLNSAHVYTPQNNTIFGNGTDVSGVLSSTTPR